MSKKRNYDFKWWHPILGLFTLSAAVSIFRKKVQPPPFIRPGIRPPNPGDAILMDEFQHEDFNIRIEKTPFPPGFRWEVLPFDSLTFDSEVGFASSFMQAVKNAKKAISKQIFD